jgi:hypothetical protein
MKECRSKGQQIPSFRESRLRIFFAVGVGGRCIGDVPAEHRVAGTAHFAVVRRVQRRDGRGRSELRNAPTPARDAFLHLLAICMARSPVPVRQI